MSLYRHRSDTTQSDIVDGLRRCGYIVFCIGQPVDLLVTHPRWPRNTWVLLEVKTPNRTGKRYRARKDQAKQQLFCQGYEIPIVVDLDSALHVLALRNVRLEAA